MNMQTIKRLKIYNERGKFLLYDPETPNWIRIPPLAVPIILRIEEKDLIITLIRRLFPEADDPASILNHLYTVIKKITKNEPQKDDQALDIEINLTDRCALNCTYCYYAYESAFSLKKEEWIDIITSASQLNPDRIVVSGGDPLLRKDVFDIALHAKDLSLSPHLVSNGLMTKNEAEKIIHNFSSIQISIDGFDEIQRYLRGISLDKVMEYLPFFIYEDISLSVGITLTSLNIDQVIPFIHYLNEIGVDQIHVSIFKPLGRGKENSYLNPTPEQLISFFLEVVHDELNVDTLFHMMPERRKKKKTCGAGSEVISVMPDGTVFPCDALIQREFSCGSALNEDLATIYEESSVLHMVRNISVESSEICSSCDFRYLCGGGCIGETFSQRGSLTIPGENCSFLKKFYRKFLWVS
jgi:radical SAM protein with 4Fe4S-binding SPASM domain